MSVLLKLTMTALWFFAKEICRFSRR